MRANSLAVRLIVAAGLWSALALIVAGFILTSLYRHNAERAFDDRMGVYLKTLIGNLAGQDPDEPFSDPGNLGEQRFELLYSGWYWQVRQPGGGAVVLSSRSLFSDTLDIAKATATTTVDGVTSGALFGPDGQHLRVLSQTVTFDPNRRFDVLVAGDAGDLERQVRDFGTNVALTLAIFGIGLILATTIQTRWGLRPLDRVRRGLTDVRSGKEARFVEQQLPAEIEPLVKELNALLESNKEIIDRARTQVGNLAHALKTPLSVIINESRANRSPFGTKVAEQAEAMRSQVNHYLDRARIAAQVNVIGAVTDVPPVIARLVRAMRRIHSERGIEISETGPQPALFKGEQQDLEEIVGNLVDNACKWAKGRVTVATTYTAPTDGNAGGLTITVDDDGPGLTPEQMSEATARGKRLDETKPGSGLGLSIVTDLVQLYQGTFHLDRSPIGGLRAVVTLPAA
ncbi:MAG TPA: ATP-binding protein [Bauldia sp.]|nr:ATP-binding protein [Bauldia sp.]